MSARATHRASLVHRCTVIPKDSDSEGNKKTDDWGNLVTEQADYEKMPCWIDLRTRRILDSNNQIRVWRGSILFGEEATILVGFEIKDGKLPDGTVVLNDGRVTAVDPILSATEGLIGYRCSIERQ